MSDFSGMATAVPTIEVTESQGDHPGSTSYADSRAPAGASQNYSQASINAEGATVIIDPIPR